MAFNNIGNRRFRVTVSIALERYKHAKTRKEKTREIANVLKIVHGNGGRFLVPVRSSFNKTNVSEPIGNVFMELNDKQSHEKAGHALRDMACTLDTNSYNDRTTIGTLSSLPFQQDNCINQQLSSNIFDSTQISLASANMYQLLQTKNIQLSSSSSSFNSIPNPFDTLDIVDSSVRNLATDDLPIHTRTSKKQLVSNNNNNNHQNGGQNVMTDINMPKLNPEQQLLLSMDVGNENSLLASLFDDDDDIDHHDILLHHESVF